MRLSHSSSVATEVEQERFKSALRAPETHTHTHTRGCLISRLIRKHTAKEVVLSSCIRGEAPQLSLVQPPSSSQRDSYRPCVPPKEYLLCGPSPFAHTHTHTHTHKTHTHTFGFGDLTMGFTQIKKQTCDSSAYVFSGFSFFSTSLHLRVDSR